jgi:hypothetical protein
MTRLFYGAAPADFVVAQGAQAEIFDAAGVGMETFGRPMLLPLTTVAFDVFTDAALTTPTTDLLDAEGGSIEQVMSLTEFDNRGSIGRFQGPDGHTGPLWLSADAVTGFRFEPDSAALYARAGAAEDALVEAASDITALEGSVTSLDGRLDDLEAVPDSPNVQYFTSDGTWTKPAGAQRVFAECQGAGGGGGGAATTAAGQGAEGGGGGGGGYAAEWFDADDLSATEDITVGVGGSGAIGASGTTGGDSEFGAAQFGADGGGFGSGGAATSTALHAPGGFGGTRYDNGSGVPSIVRDGGQGHPGVVLNGITYRQNSGGSSEGDGESLLTSATASGDGVAGTRGGGGSGGRNAASQGTARAGGAGGNGYVRVTTFF